MTKTFSHYTGRKYNGEQNLVITVVPVTPADEFGIYTADVTFVDNSRGISGVFKGMLIFDSGTPQEVGRVVLSMYDKGLYELV